MANVLDKIVADKRIELEQRKAQRPLESFIEDVVPTKRDFEGALAATGTQFILECKRPHRQKCLFVNHSI